MIRSENSMGRVSVEMVVANNQDVQLAARGLLPPDQVRQVSIQGIVDSGAAHLVLPLEVARQLDLPPAGEARVRYADGRTGVRSVVEEVRVQLLGRQSTFRAIVEPDRTTALIGAIVLEDLDFLVDCAAQRLEPRDPDRVVSEIE